MRHLAIVMLFASACAAPDLSSGDGSSTEFQLSVTPTHPVAASSAVPAVLRNRSGRLARIGAIGSYMQFDRLRSTGWEPLPREYPTCIQPEYTIPDGGDFPFQFGAPDRPGTYRLRVNVEDVLVRSTGFTVR